MSIGLPPSFAMSRKTVRLVPDVEHCVACGLAGEAVPLVVKRADKCSSPTVYAEHGRLKGELNGLSCPRCSAWHSMSYAEGGTRIPAGKQVPYPGATASSRRWIQLSQSTVRIRCSTGCRHRWCILTPASRPSVTSGQCGAASQRTSSIQCDDASGTPGKGVAPALARRECVAGGGAATI